MTESQAQTTRFCARVIGPILLIVGSVVVFRAEDLALMVPAILQDGALSFITGLFTLIVGVVLFTAHHHWNGAVAIAVSLIGVLTILRGALLMLSPSLLAGPANQLMNAGPAPMLAGLVAAIVGLWLTWAGWLSRTTA
ncbi:MAG: hypothetical protein R3C16_10140 [Hyphomonadaceae bacterium]